MMKQFLQTIRNTAIAGFFFLFPLYVVFLVLTKAWTSFSSWGANLAAMFGVKSILGLGGKTVFTSLFLIFIWLLCGLLVRISFVGALGRSLETFIANSFPGYASYRAKAEEKLQHKIRIIPYASALLKQGDCWQPAFVIEQNAVNAILFVPDVPETDRGRVLLAPIDQVQFIPSLTANEFDASLKATGKGLLSRFEISPKQG